MQATCVEDGTASRLSPLRSTPTAMTPKQRAEQPAVAALERGAADRDGGDGVELHADAGGRMRRIEPRRHQQRRKAGHQAAEDIDPDQHAAHGNAGNPQRFAVAAEREHIGAEARVIKQRVGDEHRRARR